ncbi:MAG: pyridoxamine 5'-phosphate oxidase family protein [Chitinophagales bacterium]
MDQSLLEKARELLNLNLPTTTLSTVDKEYNVNVAVISIIEMLDDNTILCARFGAERTYANLKQTGKGVFMVLVFDGEKRKDGIRVSVELTGDETDGPNFQRIKDRLNKTKYRDFPLKNCLVFRATDVIPVSTLGKAP